MADPSFDEVVSWLQANSGAKGSPEYVRNAELYRQYRTQQIAQPQAAAPQPATGPVTYNMNVGRRRGQPPPAPLPVDEDPYSPNNTAHRVMTGAIAGIPDLGIAAYNAGARAFDAPDAQIEPLQSRMLRRVDAQPLPADAGAMRTILEGIGSAAVGGGASAAARAAAAAPSVLRMAPAALANLTKTTVAPTAAGYYGGQAAEKTLGTVIDPETANLIGALFTGAAPSAAPAAGRAAVNRSYRGHGAPNAAETAMRGERAGLPVTPAAIGDQSVRNLQQSLARRPGSSGAVREAQQNLHTAMQGGVTDVAAQRGTVTTDNPSVIGQNINEVATDATTSMMGRAGQAQNALRDRIGADTQGSAGPVLQTGRELIERAPNISQRDAVTNRMENYFNPLLTRDAQGNVPLGPDGRPLISFGRAQGFSTETGQAIDAASGQRLPPLRQLYPPTREVMANISDSAGVPRQNFENVQNRYRDTVALRDEIEPLTTREPQQAYNYLLEGGETNPGRLQAFDAAATGDPRIGDIMASHIGQLSDVIGRGAQGPINYARRIERMNPESLDIIAPQGAERLQDIAHVAREVHRPTEQGGTSTAGLDVMSSGNAPLAAGGGGAAAATGLGLSPWLGAAALAGLPLAINDLRRAMLFSQSARRGMLGEREPMFQRPDMAELVATLNAISAGAQAQ